MYLMEVSMRQVEGPLRSFVGLTHIGQRERLCQHRKLVARPYRGGKWRNRRSHLHALHNHRFVSTLKSSELEVSKLQARCFSFRREVDDAMERLFCRVVIQCGKTTVLLDDLIYAFQS